jgi:hypothetical protein
MELDEDLRRKIIFKHEGKIGWRAKLGANTPDFTSFSFLIFLIFYNFEIASNDTWHLEVTVNSLYNIELVVTSTHLKVSIKTVWLNEYFPSRNSIRVSDYLYIV